MNRSRRIPEDLLSRRLRLPTDARNSSARTARQTITVRRRVVATQIPSRSPSFANFLKKTFRNLLNPSKAVATVTLASLSSLPELFTLLL